MALTPLERVWRALAVVSLIALLLALATMAFGAEEKGLSIGDKVPSFTLKDQDGKKHTLAELKGKIIVLDFSSHECPWSRGADVTLKDVAKTYGAHEVVFLGIDSHKDTTPDEIKAYVHKNKIPFAILKDEKNEYADKVGASHTPEIYIVDKDGKLAYHGAYDDRKAPDKPGTVNYVAKALDDLLADRPVAVTEVKAWGCTIKRVAKPKPATAGPSARPRSGSGAK